MLSSLLIVAGCGPVASRIAGFWPTKRRAVPSAPGVGLDTSPRFGCCLETKVAIRELPGNVEASNFSLTVARSRRLLVLIGELVDSGGWQFASTLCLLSQKQEVPNG
jgi:hypothetical protein